MDVYSWKRTTQIKTKINVQKLDFFYLSHFSENIWIWVITLKVRYRKVQHLTLLFENVILIPHRGLIWMLSISQIFKSLIHASPLQSLDNLNINQFNWPPINLCFHGEIWWWLHCRSLKISGQRWWAAAHLEITFQPLRLLAGWEVSSLEDADMSCWAFPGGLELASAGGTNPRAWWNPPGRTVEFPFWGCLTTCLHAR